MKKEKKDQRTIRTENVKGPQRSRVKWGRGNFNEISFVAKINPLVISVGVFARRDRIEMLMGLNIYLKEANHLSILKRIAIFINKAYFSTITKRIHFFFFYPMPCLFEPFTISGSTWASRSLVVWLHSTHYCAELLQGHAHQLPIR
jgi:hypothetical protein